ncbi:thiolase family protein [Alicyclobacillus cycloheptanicus]|uniref:Acetyl-CoA C-acetyltransferase n=1 Tax=Alicyclobacillus cycloheptanicus TaxID=1457 RepID=A0ABT9XH36_9BACL|nr:thiolase family protein [Alicyclobacillus cycloheptanicus]MDQ0189123.1 acetyl-CoA C-acetyltransferase [Alicyclobacillus cycloheptanicus]WDM00251.1 thiolase family protein [Alicyclobacillus cycloheptanicus]
MVVLQEHDAIVVAAKRTAVGKVGGGLREVPVEHLAGTVLQDLVRGAQVNPERIDQVILGNVVGPGGNVARLSALTAGLPLSVPGYTVDMQCGSGLQAIHLAAQEVQSGHGDIYLAGGVESSSRAPWKLEKPQNPYRQSPRVYERARFSPDTIGDPDMGVAAENVARAYHISRDAQDELALASHQRAVAAQQTGVFTAEIVPVETPCGGWFTVDEGPRVDTSLDKLRRLPPVFVKDGTVTAGNACSINDGASIVLLLSVRAARELGFSTGLRYVDCVVTGVDPNLLGIGPIPAVQKLFHRQSVTMDEMDLIEFNEAFASQVLACMYELNIPFDRMNVNGGAIALGHPYGASGALLVTHLFHELIRRHGRYGLTTMGVGGGLGIAALWERVTL